MAKPRFQKRKRRLGPAFRPRVIERLEARMLLATLVVNNAADTGTGSLRQAILDSNASVGIADVIEFAIPGAGPHPINVGAGGLPAITDPVTIDGYTQGSNTAGDATDDAIENTSPVGQRLNTVLKIAIDGSGAGGSANGFHLDTGSGGSTIRGLAITDFGGDGIQIDTNGNFVEGNFIGTAIAGTAADGNTHGVHVTGSSNTIGGTNPNQRNLLSGNSGAGVFIDGGSENFVRGNIVGTNAAGTAAIGNSADGVSIVNGPNNSIGGTASGAGNLISGNGGNGVVLVFAGATGNVIQGNRIGTNVTGTSAIGNGVAGVLSFQAPNATIGGSASSAGNLISGNNSDGVSLSASANGATIQGNLIGTDAAGTGGLGNAGHGINVASINVTIGGTDPNDGNTIAFNTFDGISASVDLRILSNLIFSNGGLGIDLAEFAATEGPNFPQGPEFQHFPIVTSVTDNGGSTTVSGSLITTPGTYRIDLFASAAADPTGFGEGQTLLGSVDVNATTGAASFTTTVAALPAGQTIVTVTATDLTDNATSEFSPAFAPMTFTVTTTADGGAGSLRQAILSANAHPGFDIIDFNIPVTDASHLYYSDDGVAGQVTAANVNTTTEADDANIADVDPDWMHSWYSVGLQSALPEVVDTVLIDGNTQAGTVVNSNAVGLGLDTVLRIELSGENAGTVTDGLLRLLDHSGSTARGLVVNQASGVAVQSENGGANLIQGSFLGTDVSGTLSDGVTLVGLRTKFSAANQIGGTDPSERNLIAAGTGVSLQGFENMVAGNLVGTDRLGQGLLGSNSVGVLIESVGGHRNVIGGPVAAAGNVISGSDVGLDVRGDDALIQNNLIGTDVSGTQDIGNTNAGIEFAASSTGTQTIENVIAFNGVGINVDQGDAGHLISENSIFDNDGLGIVIANNRQDAPTLKSVTDIGGATRIMGTLPTTAASTYRVEFFSIDEREGFLLDQGEGKTFLGSVNVAGTGSVESFTFDAPELAPSEPYVTATATDITDNGSGSANNTSEFSLIETLSGCSLTVTSTADAGPGTLREAIVCANLAAGSQTIDFNIPADDPRHFYYQNDGITNRVTFENTTVTAEADDANIFDIDPDWPHSWFGIILDDELPPITDTVTIDGYTQVGASRNTQEFPFGLDTVLRIEIDGRNVEQDGMSVLTGAEGSRIEGLSINAFGGHGILLNSFGTNTIAGNFIGPDVSGTLNFGNGGNGVVVAFEDGDTIGGSNVGSPNLISGNVDNGVEVLSGSGHLISGNRMGSDRSGTVMFEMEGSHFFLSNDESRVPQSANGSNKTAMSGTLQSTAFGPVAYTGNRASSLADGLENGRYIAQEFRLDSSFRTTSAQLNNVMSVGTLLNKHHVKSNPKQSGQSIDRQSAYAISFDPTAVARTVIDLGDDGVTPNDSGDADDGPNGLQNFPVVGSAITTNGTTSISGTLNSLASSDFRIELYSSSYNTKVLRAGEKSLGTIDVTTDSNGDASFTFVSPEVVPPGHFVTSLATRLQDFGGTLEPIETSEFSDGLAIAGSFDFGDAPDTYGTTHASPFAVFGGARHTPTGVTLGSERDAESDAVAPLVGTGDDISNTGSADDEDGVDFGAGGAVLPVGQVVPINVDIQNSSGDARLYAWIDFNGDGDFLDDGEQIADGTGSFANLGNGIVTLNVTAPATGFGGTSYARFRVSTDAGLDYDGQASDGEVEDYKVVIVPGELFVVDSTADTPDNNTADNICDDGTGSCTLRAAIQQANATANVPAGPDVIIFNLPGTEPHTISPLTALPTIIDAVSIDGTCEPDFAGSPVVQIDGNNTVTDGLLITAGGSTVRGLSLTGFVDAGLEFFGDSGNTAADNYLGITPDGAARGNRFGVKVINSSDNVISSNVISGNRDNGVFINGVEATGNVVEGNRIGSDPDGMARVPNLRHGVTLFAPDNFVTHNLISGNNGWGVFTRFSTGGGNVIDRNHIGVDATGLAPLANASGIQIRSPNNVITDNTISGNIQGVIIANADSHGTVVQGNLIGTDPTGMIDVGNGVFGVGIFSSQLNVIGGIAAGESNVISGNGLDGVILARTAATDNSVVGNKIGTNAGGSAAIPNDGDGVRIVQGASLNVVASNLISGNGVRGIAIDGTDTSDNTIDSNFIGTTNLGGGTLHNANNVAVLITAPNNSITGNVVSAIDAAIVAFTSRSIGNTISGNDIGSDPTLATPDGIHLLNGATGTSITANTVANGERAIILTNAGNGNDISQNVIFGNTQIGIDLGGDGVTPNDGTDADEGPNRLQDTPSFTSAAVINGTDLAITYFVSSHPSVASFPMRIEFFATNDGQARILLGTDIYSRSNRTAGSKTISFAGVASLLAAGDQLTATATDAEGNTSELSLIFPIAP